MRGDKQPTTDTAPHRRIRIRIPHIVNVHGKLTLTTRRPPPGHPRTRPILLGQVLQRRRAAPLGRGIQTAGVAMAALAALATAQRRDQMRRQRGLVGAGFGGVADGVAVDAVAGLVLVLGPLLPEHDGRFEEGLGGARVEAVGPAVEGRVAGRAGADAAALDGAVGAGFARFARVPVLFLV